MVSCSSSMIAHQNSRNTSSSSSFSSPSSLYANGESVVVAESPSTPKLVGASRRKARVTQRNVFRLPQHHLQHDEFEDADDEESAPTPKIVSSDRGVLHPSHESSANRYAGNSARRKQQSEITLLNRNRIRNKIFETVNSYLDASAAAAAAAETSRAASSSNYFDRGPGIEPEEDSRDALAATGTPFLSTDTPLDVDAFYADDFDGGQNDNNIIINNNSHSDNNNNKNNKNDDGGYLTAPAIKRKRTLPPANIDQVLSQAANNKPANRDLSQTEASRIEKHVESFWENYDFSEEPVALEELEQFAKLFKQKRIKLGFTQGDVGLAMGKLYGTDFSQTTISRFEALNLSFKNMCKLKPLLVKWLADTESAVEKGTFESQILKAQSSSEIANAKRRKKRTSIEGNLRTMLEDVFQTNSRPSVELLETLAKEMNMDREVIRVWFCNRRQKEKRTNPDRTDSLVDGAGSDDRCTGSPSGFLLYAQNSVQQNDNTPSASSIV